LRKEVTRSTRQAVTAVEGAMVAPIEYTTGEAVGFIVGLSVTGEPVGFAVTGDAVSASGTGDSVTGAAVFGEVVGEYVCPV
jgi:hypothetical protein